MDKVFAIGDIHGNIDLLNTLLIKWNPDEEQLVFLGDYIDRGNSSFQVLNRVIELSKQYGAITLSGNHEELFINWLKNPEQLSAFYVHPKVGGAATIESFYKSSIDETLQQFSFPEIAEKIKNDYGEIVDFVENLLKYFHWDPYLFVHAGIDSTVENFLETKEKDFLWIREEFSQVPHKAKEIVIFGHTPTLLLNEDKSSDVWISPCRKKIGIDGGGAIYEEGQLHGIVLSKDVNEPIIVHSVNRKLNIKTSSVLL